MSSGPVNFNGVRKYRQRWDRNKRPSICVCCKRLCWTVNDDRRSNRFCSLLWIRSKIMIERMI